MDSDKYTAEKTGFVKEYLTNSELKRLVKLTLGYGNFKTIAINAGLHVETLRGVIHRGYGTPETIRKIRTLLHPESKVA